MAQLLDLYDSMTLLAPILLYIRRRSEGSAGYPFGTCYAVNQHDFKVLFVPYPFINCSAVSWQRFFLSRERSLSPRLLSCLEFNLHDSTACGLRQRLHIRGLNMK